MIMESRSAGAILTPIDKIDYFYYYYLLD